MKAIGLIMIGIGAALVLIGSGISLCTYGIHHVVPVNILGVFIVLGMIGLLIGLLLFEVDEKIETWRAKQAN